MNPISMFIAFFDILYYKNLAPVKKLTPWAVDQSDRWQIGGLGSKA